MPCADNSWLDPISPFELAVGASLAASLSPSSSLPLDRSLRTPSALATDLPRPHPQPPAMSEPGEPAAAGAAATEEMPAVIPLTKEEALAKFKEACQTQSVDQQAMTFLKAFVTEFQGKFEPVLKLAEEFKTFAANARGEHIQELDEFECHRFLEMHGEAKTVKDMRDALADMDIDNNKKVAFLEYIMFQYQRTPTQLFTAKPNTALLKKLEEAVELYKKHFAEQQAKAAKVAELEAAVASGGAGAAKAKVELMRLKGEDPGKVAKDELGALHAKLAAKRALRNPEEEERRQFEAEQAKLADEKAEQERQDKLKKQQSRDRLKAKASLWQ